MAEETPDAGPSNQAAPSKSILSEVTPRSGKSHGGTTVQTRLRLDIAREMIDEILECPVDVFLGHYAPFKPSDQSAILASNELQAASLLKKVGEGPNTSLVFADYTEPVDGPEPQVFKSLENILRVLQSKEVNDATGRNRLFSYKDCPSSYMASEIDGTNFKVDACVTSDPEARTVLLSDVVAVAEFKKTDDPGDIEDNRLKLISAAAQIMNDDPRRMWVYGITIEGTQMAVWYFCRSHSVKSVPFDFARDSKTFIRIFLSLLYATEPEIGYDPTVHRVVHNEKICYVYEIGTEEAPRYYRTTELIFAARVLCITGRKTRIWKAVEVKGYRKSQFGVEKHPGHVVLKDGWLDEGAPSEQQNQEAIFNRLRNIQPDDYAWASDYLRDLIAGTLQDEKYKEYFMEISDSRQLGKTKIRHESAQPNFHILSFAEQKPINPLHLRSGTTQSGDHSGLPANASSLTSRKKNNPLPREYKTKEQHRLIYCHVGCPLSDVRDLSASFYAIHDTFIALVLLYLARWTHRDVSAGNIIVVEKNGHIRGKLSDLEYAKEFSDGTFSADPKTGTPFFMPLEIHRSRIIYKPDFRERPLKINKGKNPRTSQVIIPPPEEDKGARPVKFRFQHDLESLWWVLVWVLLYRVGGDVAHVLADGIFTYSDTPSEARTTFFTTKDGDLLKHIHEKLKFLVPIVQGMWIVLMSSYLDEEKSKNIMDPSTYGDIYDDMWDGIVALYEAIKDVNGIEFQHPKPKPIEENKHENNHAEKNIKKRSRSKSKSKDDGEYTSGRRNSTRAKMTPTGFHVNKTKRATQLPRRKMG